MKQYRLDKLSNGLWGLMEAEDESSPWQEVYIGTDRLFAHTRKEMEEYIQAREVTKRIDPATHHFFVKSAYAHPGYRRALKDTSQELSDPILEG